LGSASDSVFENAAMRKYTVDEACDALQNRYELKGQYSAQNESHLARVRTDLGHYRVCQLTSELISEYAKQRIADKYRPATINRTLQMLRRALNLARDCQRVARAPKMELLDESDNVREDCFSNEAELSAVISYLPIDLQDFTHWCAACGMRKGEAGKLTWTMLDERTDPFRLKIPARLCKNKKDRVLPMVGELAEIIERRKAARQVSIDGLVSFAEFIFHREGKPIREFRKSWKTATKKASCPGRLFHSTRRFAATAMLEAGLSPQMAMKWTGHTTQKMLERYGLIKPDKMAEGFTELELYRAKEQAKTKSNVIAMQSATG
jgi:integrase